MCDNATYRLLYQESYGMHNSSDCVEVQLYLFEVDGGVTILVLDTWVKKNKKIETDTKIVLNMYKNKAIRTAIVTFDSAMEAYFPTRASKEE